MRKTHAWDRERVLDLFYPTKTGAAVLAKCKMFMGSCWLAGKRKHIDRENSVCSYVGYGSPKTRDKHNFGNNAILPPAPQIPTLGELQQLRTLAAIANLAFDPLNCFFPSSTDSGPIRIVIGLLIVLSVEKVNDSLFVFSYPEKKARKLG